MKMSKSRIVADAKLINRSIPELCLNEQTLTDNNEVAQPRQKFHGINALPKKYQEREFLGDDLEYPRKGTDQGLVVIFNETFQSDADQKRTGTERDVLELVVTFGRLGYNMEEKYIFSDLNRAQILTEIATILDEDHSERNCVIVVFLTHGRSNDKLITEQGELEAEEIWRPFVTSAHFKDKPNMFIFQACKGSVSATLHTKNEKEHFSMIPKKLLVSNLPPNLLIVYASVEGYASYRDTGNGSWFVQELCRNFHAYGRRDDVTSLITRTCKCVATYFHKEATAVTKQMPLFVSTLTKKFYLTRSKDRHHTLSVRENQNKILERLEALSNRIKTIEDKIAI